MRHIPADPPELGAEQRGIERPVCLHMVGATTVQGGGGSNTFIRGLARRQRALGWEPVVVINDGAPSEEESAGQFTTRILPDVQDAKRRAYYARRPNAAPGFLELLDQLKPSVVHFHTLNTRAGLLHLEGAKGANAKTIVSYHTGGISCPQTGLLENGRSPCDGRLGVTRCTRCRLVNRGMPTPLAEVLARVGIDHPDDADRTLIGRLMSSRAMTEVFIASLRAAIELIDVFHIQARWIEKVLRINGVPKEKIAFVEMGVSQDQVPIPVTPVKAFDDTNPLRLAFAGRCSDIKGIETILGALKRLPYNAPIRISLLGQGWEAPYGRRLLAPFKGDRRLLSPRVVPAEAMLRELAAHDACLVPSVWLETGPLAVYEAMAAGLPVIGSRLGGIAERIRDNVDGILFSPRNAGELASIIQTLLESPIRLHELRRNIRPQRTFDDMAGEFDALYRGFTPSIAP